MSRKFKVEFTIEKKHGRKKGDKSKMELLLVLSTNRITKHFTEQKVKRSTDTTFQEV